jgi:hypothetical protein
MHNTYTHRVRFGDSLSMYAGTKMAPKLITACECNAIGGYYLQTSSGWDKQQQVTNIPRLRSLVAVEKSTRTCEFTEEDNVPVVS